ncbi:unnamed protein product [Miscanthus lutarioriparius]|uniref:Uncharacterized protein n=1 Tax=Miscanthus lutarioriparius TaxID=422564 RepID=A0A811QVZ4_9POAL|nr:unnamed protein product [Miscanthus lutarioriparius]
MEVCLDLGMDILWLSCEGLGLRPDYLEGDISGDDVVLHVGGWPEVVMEQGLRKPFTHYAIRETLWRFLSENSSARFVVAGHSLAGSTWASPYCLSPHTGVWLASKDVPKQINSGSIASIVVATTSSPAAVGAQLVFNEMPSWYIIILNLAYSVDVVPTFSASESYIVQKVFVRLLVENQVHLASIRDSAQLRPLPWPSFSSYAASVQLNTSIPVVLHQMGSLFCWLEFTQLRLCHLWLPGPNSPDGVLVISADSSKCQPCVLLRQLDSAKAQRHVHMSAPVCLIVAQIILVPWKFWTWFHRCTSDLFMQLTVPLVTTCLGI